jgi:DNA-binding PadR family transcriptional regulator
MSAKHALLGLLLEGPAYPYELGDRLQQRLGPAWEVNSGQLYQLVKGLEKDALIERIQNSPSDRDDRHVFAITGDGVSEFERWFDQTANGVRLCRRPLLIQITFAGPRRLQDALAKVDAYELQCAERLKEIARLRETLPADGTLIRADHLLLRLNLSADIYQLEGELRWSRHAREMLSWLSNREAVWPADRKRPEIGDHSDRPDARRELFKRMAADASAGSDDRGSKKRPKRD